MINLRKVCVLLRATSSAGKSTFATWINALFQNIQDGRSCSSADECVVCCADDFFTDKDGNYNFDVKKLGLAHNKCQTKFLKALEESVGCVVVANTNTKPSSFQYYLDLAEKYGYTVFSLVVEKRRNNKNEHLNGCPDFILERQASEIKESLKLK